MMIAAGVSGGHYLRILHGSGPQTSWRCVINLLDPEHISYRNSQRRADKERKKKKKCNRKHDGYTFQIYSYPIVDLLYYKLLEKYNNLWIQRLSRDFTREVAKKKKDKKKKHARIDALMTFISSEHAN